MARLRSGSRSSRAARAKVRRGCVEIRRGLEAELEATSPAANSPAMIATADEQSAVPRYWASSTKTRLLLVADCRLETSVTVMELSPRRRQPRLSARSRRVCFMVVYCRFTRRVCTTRATASSENGFGAASRGGMTWTFVMTNLRQIASVTQKPLPQRTQRITGKSHRGRTNNCLGGCGKALIHVALGERYELSANRAQVRLPGASSSGGGPRA